MRALGFAFVIVVTAPAIAAAQDAPPDAGIDATPASIPTPPAEKPAPAEPDVDLSVLDVDPTPADEHLNLYGFADVSWRALLDPPTSLAANYFPKENSFLVGNVNLYATKKLSRHWRSFLEVRFLYAPIIKTANGTYQSTTAPDPGDLERPVQWGGISIERVYLEYEVNAWLTVQAGSFLTPYGIWNVDHGSPAIIPTSRPYIIGESLFPRQQTGLHVYGMHPLGDYQLKYDVTLSNGRGPFQAVRDLDGNKAIGARLELETPWLDGIDFGISAYRGRFTDRPADVLAVDASGALVNTTPPGIAYDEVAWGADVLLHRGPLHVQAELIGNDRHYLPGARELARGGFQADGRYVGMYGLVGYRFDRLWQVMPFMVLELDRLRSSADTGTDPVVFELTSGLNFRPDPSVVLKLEYTQAHLGSTLLTFDTRAFVTQAAWAF